MSFTLDWAKVNLDGANTLSDGPDALGVRISTPFSGEAHKTEWFLGNDVIGDKPTVQSVDVCDPTEIALHFDRPVSDLRFDLYDVDSGKSWDDKVTIIATNARGEEVPVTFGDLEATHLVTGNTIEGEGAALSSIDGPGAKDSVSVSIAGPITGIRIIHDNGSDNAQSGTVGMSDWVFHAVPERDGIVSGTDGDDRIVAGEYVDRDGDEIDNEDAIIGDDKPNDDRVEAGDGDDYVDAGKQDDTIEGGAGDDTLKGGVGDDVIFGGKGDDTLIGGRGDDWLDGGPGDDLAKGGDGNDTLIGGPGVDTLKGGDDRDLFLVNAADDGGDGKGRVDQIFGGAGGDDVDTLLVAGEQGVDWRVVDTVTDSDGNGLDGRVEFLDGDGTVTGSLDFENIEIVCFTPGTRIATPTGLKPVEALCAGDRVLTRDNGVQEIAWYGQTGLNAADFAARPHLAPVLIRAGALGNGLPERDMMVSPQHRVLVSSDRAALYFDDREVLVAAKHLVNGTTILRKPVPQTCYIHFMCERHEVVLSDGAWTESFQPGDYSLNGIDAAQRREIVELFPELATERGLQRYAAARRTLKRHEAMLLGRCS